MKVLAVIPARYSSSRFPGKPLALINGKPMIQMVYENVSKSDLINETIVATDDLRIFNEVMAFGGKSIMTSPNHLNGTQRVVETYEILNDDYDIVLNIQGDEPLVKQTMIKKLIDGLADEKTLISTLKKRIKSLSDIKSRDIAKVVSNRFDEAIYFSRSIIPYSDRPEVNNYYKHVGMYGYKSAFLKSYHDLDSVVIEQCESLEQLRFLYYGISVKVLEIFDEIIGVDRPEHISLVEKKLYKKQ